MTLSDSVSCSISRAASSIASRTGGSSTWNMSAVSSHSRAHRSIDWPATSSSAIARDATCCARAVNGEISCARAAQQRRACRNGRSTCVRCSTQQPSHASAAASASQTMLPGVRETGGACACGGGAWTPACSCGGAGLCVGWLAGSRAAAEAQAQRTTRGLPPPAGTALQLGAERSAIATRQSPGSPCIEAARRPREERESASDYQARWGAPEGPRPAPSCSIASVFDATYEPPARPQSALA